MCQAAAQSTDCHRELNLGVAARDRGDLDEAIKHFIAAVHCDPHSSDAHFKLARAYDEKHIDSVGIDEWAKLAIPEYLKAIEINTAQIDAMKCLAYLYWNGADHNLSEHYYRKVLALDPNDVDALYSVAVIQWVRSYQLREETRVKLHKKSLLRTPACTSVRNRNLEQVNDGISLMTKANEVASDNDKLTFLWLLFIERAEIQCDDSAARKADRAEAERWKRLLLNGYCTRKDVNRKSEFPVTPPPPPPPADFRYPICR